MNISPHAAIAGHTRIGRKSFIGIAASIIDGIVIGKGVIIGAGAAVIHDIPSYTVVAGVPARSIK